MRRTAPTPEIIGKRPFCLIDIETTGLSPASEEITEIAVIRVDEHLEVRNEMSRLIRISRPVPWHITRLTGISDSLLRIEGRELASVLEESHAFVEDLPTFAHNASFDRRFLNASASRVHLGREFTVDCSIPVFKRLLPPRKGYGLPVLAAALRVSGGGAHRALADCHVLLSCLKRALAIKQTQRQQSGDCANPYPQ
ncbi:PolC-type DNA polymerase III [Haloferula chungangensis]|uniref:PolC-type DNA polymerase III n=1 Tax=Haloferula chungangensis TaxID=1048331 RepID=A0ABW2L5D2_9BACT